MEVLVGALGAVDIVGVGLRPRVLGMYGVSACEVSAVLGVKSNSGALGSPTPFVKFSIANLVMPPEGSAAAR